MVVDDAALARETVSRLLELEGFQTMRASNGKEAYATLYSQKPDLVLLDLMMPEMDGITFIRMIRGHPQWETIPVIVLTGMRDDNQLIDRAANWAWPTWFPRRRSDSRTFWTASAGRSRCEHRLTTERLAGSS